MMRGAAIVERPWFARWPADVPRSLDYPDIAVQELLRRTAREHGDRPALTFYGKTLTYRDRDATVDRVAAGLRTIGGGIEGRSEEHTSELQSRGQLVCRLRLQQK